MRTRPRFRLAPAVSCNPTEEALRWAIDDMCPMHFEPGERATAALLSYRVAMLDFHRESKRARFARVRDTAPQRPRAL